MSLGTGGVSPGMYPVATTRLGTANSKEPPRLRSYSPKCHCPREVGHRDNVARNNVLPAEQVIPNAPVEVGMEIYEWDEAKRNTNLSKHGVDFAQAEFFVMGGSGGDRGQW
jgi:hypothetical protein